MNLHRKHLLHAAALASVLFLCAPAMKADKVRTYTTNAKGNLMLERKNFSTSASCGNNVITRRWMVSAMPSPTALATTYLR